MESAFIELSGEDKYSAIKSLVMSSPVFESVDREMLLSSVILREREQSTYIGHGVSITHGRIEGLGRTLIALGISHDGITGDREPIHFLFTIASSPENPGAYLSSVAAILSWMHSAEFREKLLSGQLSDPSVLLFLNMIESQDFRAL